MFYFCIFQMYPVHLKKVKIKQIMIDGDIFGIPVIVKYRYLELSVL